MNRTILRTDPQHPPCEGGEFYGPHAARVTNGYTVIGPDGRARYLCDLDCLRRHVERVEARAWSVVRSESLAFLRRGGDHAAR